MWARSIPVRRKTGQRKSSHWHATRCVPRPTSGATRLPIMPAAKCPMNMSEISRRGEHIDARRRELELRQDAREIGALGVAARSVELETAQVAFGVRGFGRFGAASRDRRLALG